jgi:hypothetical protein
MVAKPGPIFNMEIMANFGSVVGSVELMNHG